MGGGRQPKVMGSNPNGFVFFFLKNGVLISSFFISDERNEWEKFYLLEQLQQEKMALDLMEQLHFFAK